MRMWKYLLIILVTFLYLPIVMAKGSIEGIWTTVDDKTGKKRAVVELTVENRTLFGKILHVYSQSGDTGVCSKCTGEFKNKPIKGLQFVWGLNEKIPGAWDGGFILDAKSGKIYRAKMTLKGNKLYVRGYVGISLMGRTQIWERTNNKSFEKVLKS